MKKLALGLAVIVVLAVGSLILLRKSPSRSASFQKTTPQPLNGPSVEWVTIPEGVFLMGGDKGSNAPRHQVKIKTFQIARTLVTNRQYAACVRASACAPVEYKGNTKQSGDDYPVVWVDWSQAEAYSRWVGGRLPSEAEWEYAARSAGKDRRYPWGDQEPKGCTLAKLPTCSGYSVPVCSTPLGNTEQGLCDMAGNAWEWVQDVYHPSYVGGPTDGSSWVDPSSNMRVRRGGSWFDATGFIGGAQTTFRGAMQPAMRSFDLGFRPARSLNHDERLE